ncbi:MAG: hypothetical protein J4G04_08475 [Nitrosopumilaceae archaeon]|nr:hypothetical protein [Nitrosopumilaceae archaeon]
MINAKIIDFIGRGMSMLVVSPDAKRDVWMNLKPAARLTEDDRSRIDTKQKIFGPETADGVRMYLKNVLGGSSRKDG